MERAAVGSNAGNIDARVLKLYQRVSIRATNGTVQRNATYPDHQQRDRAGCVVIKVDHFVFSFEVGSDFSPDRASGGSNTHFIKMVSFHIWLVIFLICISPPLAWLFAILTQHVPRPSAPILAFPFPPAAK